MMDDDKSDVELVSNGLEFSKCVVVFGVNVELALRLFPELLESIDDDELSLLVLGQPQLDEV